MGIIHDEPRLFRSKGAAARVMGKKSMGSVRIVKRYIVLPRKR